MEVTEERSLEQAKRAAAVNVEVVKANNILKQQLRVSKSQVQMVCKVHTHCTVGKVSGLCSISIRATICCHLRPALHYKAQVPLQADELKIENTCLRSTFKVPAASIWLAVNVRAVQRVSHTLLQLPAPGEGRGGQAPDCQTSGSAE